MAKTYICDKDLCTGCSACMNICPKNAIIMEEDNCGYIHPSIDPLLCIDCNLCEKTCPVVHPMDLRTPLKTLAAVSVDDKERKTSSSGGAASVISRWVIENGGIVYGCCQENYQIIHHIRVASVEEISLLKGSKYVHSKIEYTFRTIKQDLRTKRQVLFIGTPCQVAGLKRFLKKDYENLLTADLICHGVPSQKMLREDVEAENFFNKEVEQNIKVNFRWKSKYGIQYGMQYGNVMNKQLLYSKSLPYDPYIFAFFTGFSFRENCHNCPYSRSNRIGDVTIGDFWRLGAHKSTKFKIKDGVSLILVNSDKGQKVLSALDNRFILEERSLEEAVAGNDNLRRPSPRPQNKDLFLSIYQKNGLKRACKEAIPTKLFYKIALVEYVKQHQSLMTMLKRLRLYIHKIKNR